MSETTRVQSYPGLYPSQAAEAFRADAVEAARHGWHPISQQWNGQALVVTYGLGSADRWAAPSGAPPTQLVSAVQAPIVQAAAVVIGASIAIAVGSFLPWASATNGFVAVEQTGVGGGDGWIALILAGVLALSGWSTLRGSSGGTWITVLVGSALVVGLALYEIVDITRRSVANILEYGVPIQTGAGLLIILAAGVVAGLASFGLRKRKAAGVATQPVPGASPATRTTMLSNRVTIIWALAGGVVILAVMLIGIGPFAPRSGGDTGGLGVVATPTPRLVVPTPTPWHADPTPASVTTGYESTSFAEMKALAKKVGYKALLRDSDAYTAELVYFKGKVLQVGDDGTGGQAGLISVTKDEYGFWDDNVAFVWASSPRVVPDDIVEFVMMSGGTYGYESAGAGYLTVPSGIILKLRLVG